MKHWIAILFLLTCHLSLAGSDYRKHFTRDALRIDLLLAGDAEEEVIYLRRMKKEPYWSGPESHLVKPFGYGHHQVRVTDTTGEQILYSRGFSTLFGEWQTTAESSRESRAFQHTIRIPFPRHPVVVQVKQRGADEPVLWEYRIQPQNYFILNEQPAPAEVVQLDSAGDPSGSVDLAFVAEGYRKQERDKFIEDVRKMSDYILSRSPFDRYRDRFNIYAVQAVSLESGTDVPGEHIYKNTAGNTSYYTFDVPRYLTTFNAHTIRDYAANVPYDHIFLLINTDRYGGGGIYNHYSASTTGHMLSPKVAIHEFGHGFAGLGDEYYNSGVAYNDFYNLEEEPWEPNLTTLVDFESKWQDMVDEDTPVPTSREPQYRGKVGVFEGGGYVSKGVYSPAMNCRMKSNQAEGFCPVCQRAIERMILYYLDEL